MVDPFVAEVRIFGFSFPPIGWAFCNGQLLPLSQNTALFSLLGTTYGGNGLNTFALPDLQGSAPMQQGQGPGLSLRDLGEMGGTESVTLLSTEIPAHTHLVKVATGNPPETNSPAGAVLSTTNRAVYSTIPASNNYMAAQAIAPVGSDFPHNNMQPYLTMNFCIALQGVFPARP